MLNDRTCIRPRAIEELQKPIIENIKIMGEGRVALNEPSMRFFGRRQWQCALGAKQTQESDDNVYSVWRRSNFVGVEFGFDVALDDIGWLCRAPLQFVDI